MTPQTRLIQIAGVVVAFGILAIGLVLGALPMASQALQNGKLEASALDTVASVNAEIASLQGKMGETDSLEAELARQHEGVPELEQFQDIVRAISVAADTAGVTPETLDQSGQSAYTGVNSAIQAQATTAPSASASESAQASATASATPSADTGQAQVAVPGDAAQWAAKGFAQIPITITLGSPDTDSAVTFVNELRQSTRLVDINMWTVEMSSGSTSQEPYTITVDALIFVFSGSH